jgi:hypothetical protein
MAQKNADLKTANEPHALSDEREKGPVDCVQLCEILEFAARTLRLFTAGLI